MSVELFFPHPECQRRARDGPLADDIDAFAAWLAAEGYAPFTVKEKLRFAADVGRWCASRKLAVEDLDEDQITAFHASREPQQRRPGDAASGRQLLELLRSTGRIPFPHSGLSDDDPGERIAQTYKRFLLDERGVNPSTAAKHLPTVRRFLAECFGGREITLESLSAQDANRFILRGAQRLSGSTTKRVGTILRSFLRHLHQRGAIAADLAGAVPTITHWRQAGLPKALRPEQVEAILSSCDRSSVAGRRDYAILLLLARLGLRGGEVAALTLDDFDWHAGIVNVSGKGPRREPLPLPHDVGDAVADYLRNGRPPGCPTRRVFVRLRAPQRGFACTSSIDNIVHRALARAQLDPPFKGAHLLRHSLATGMSPSIRTMPPSPRAPAGLLSSQDGRFQQGCQAHQRGTPPSRRWSAKTIPDTNKGSKPDPIQTSMDPRDARRKIKWSERGLSSYARSYEKTCEIVC